MIDHIYWFLRRRIAGREPDFVIGDDYCRRWWLIPRNRWFNIYFHQFLHSDDDRALHDHPWWNLSVVLAGSYREHLGGAIESSVLRSKGAIVFRRAKTAHRVELRDGQCWTLFFTGPVIREWGFHCPQGWRHWKDFVAARDKGRIGRGCD